MNAVPNPLLREAAELSESVVRPIPGSRKIHVEGSRADVRVPMREIELADTPTASGVERNAPFVVYDTSDPEQEHGRKIVVQGQLELGLDV